MTGFNIATAPCDLCSRFIRWPIIHGHGYWRFCSAECRVIGMAIKLVPAFPMQSNDGFEQMTWVAI